MSSDSLNVQSQYKDGYCAITLDNHVQNDSSDLPFVSLRPKRRMVKRSDGRSCVRHTGITTHTWSFFQDGFTTLINSNWYFIIFVFCTLYIISWLVFGCVWTAVAYAHGGSNNSCVVDVEDFSSGFLFSIEVQMTIGFGNKFITHDCHSGIFMLVLQSLIGLLLDSFLLGLIFAKLTRPRNRRKTIVFSKVAVIREKDGHRVFEFRIGDVRRSQLVEGHVRLQLCWHKLVDPLNHRYEFQQFDLDVGYDTGRDRVFLLTPVSVYHYITEDSPLFDQTQAQLEAMNVELIAILEGIVEATGLTVQALWSYTNDEILFDRKFVPVVRRSEGKWEVDLGSGMHETVPMVGQ